MIVAAMLAVALVVAIPAVAQVAGGVGQESESGDVALKDAVSNEGDYASQCTPAVQFGNTGNFNNGSAFVQFGSDNNNDDDFNHFNDRRDHFGFFDDNFNRGLDDFEP